MKEDLLNIVKSKLGITSNVRDELLKFIINATLSELKDEHKLKITEENKDKNLNLKEFVIDYVCFKYKNTEYKGVPRFLQFRLHNLKVNRMRKENDI